MLKGWKIVLFNAFSALAALLDYFGAIDMRAVLSAFGAPEHVGTIAVFVINSVNIALRCYTNTAVGKKTDG